MSRDRLAEIQAQNGSAGPSQLQPVDYDVERNAGVEQYELQDRSNRQLTLDQFLEEVFPRGKTRNNCRLLIFGRIRIGRMGILPGLKNYIMKR